MRLDELNGHHVTVPQSLTLGLRPILEGQPLIDNVNATFERKLTRFQDIAVTEDRGPISICAAGPSINESIEEITNIDRTRDRPHPVMVCGSAHDHLVKRLPFIRYCALFDPQPLVKNTLRNPRNECTYLVASICDPSVFDALRGHDIAVWHPAGSVDFEHYRGEMAVTGGSSVTLRAMVLAFLLGHKEQHIYGFDCCHAETTHAFGNYEDIYQDADLLSRNGQIPVTFNGRSFVTTAELMEQAFEFLHQVKLYGNLFNPIVHGNGLAAALLEDHRAQNVRCAAQD